MKKQSKNRNSLPIQAKIKISQKKYNYSFMSFLTDINKLFIISVLRNLYINHLNQII
jgi:hypothetical protein